MSKYIPEDIRARIFQKLPVKTLMRFTCISKSTLALIKDPIFISNHLKHSNKKTPLVLVRHKPLQNNIQHTERFSLYPDKQSYRNPLMSFHFPVNTHNPNSCFIVVGTVSGLICVLHEARTDTDTIVIWNPLSKQSVTLPKPNSTRFETVCYGFGFDSCSNDYKLLRLADRLSEVKVDGEEEEPDEDTLEAEIYSLKTNSWRWISAPRYMVKTYDTQVFVNGVMHVLAFRKLRNKEYCNVVLGFDMSDEAFENIALPPNLVNANPYFLRLFVCKESIAVLEEDWIGPGGFNVWVMEEYGAVELWTMIVGFGGKQDVWPTVYGFRKNGELVLQMRDGEIVLCDPKSNKRKIRPSGSYPLVNYFDYFVESLGLLDNPNAESDPPVGNDVIGDAAGDAIGVPADDATGANDPPNQSD